jgi:hypothetical protein
MQVKFKIYFKFGLKKIPAVSLSASAVNHFFGIVGAWAAT